jgi:hypothetical protein
MLQYALLAVIVTYFLAIAPTLVLQDRINWAVVIVLSTISLGWLLEGRRFARIFEVARLTALCALLAVFALPTL